MSISTVILAVHGCLESTTEAIHAASCASHAAATHGTISVSTTEILSELVVLVAWTSSTTHAHVSTASASDARVAVNDIECLYGFLISVVSLLFASTTLFVESLIVIIVVVSCSIPCAKFIGTVDLILLISISLHIIWRSISTTSATSHSHSSPGHSLSSHWLVMLVSLFVLTVIVVRVVVVVTPTSGATCSTGEVHWSLVVISWLSLISIVSASELTPHVWIIVPARRTEVTVLVIVILVVSMSTIAVESVLCTATPMATSTSAWLHLVRFVALAILIVSIRWLVVVLAGKSVFLHVAVVILLSWVVEPAMATSLSSLTIVMLHQVFLIMVSTWWNMEIIQALHWWGSIVVTTTSSSHTSGVGSS